MKKAMSFVVSAMILIIVLLYAFHGPRPLRGSQSQISNPGYAPDEVLVRFKEIANSSIIATEIDALNATIISDNNAEIAPRNWNPDLSAHKSFMGDAALFRLKLPDYISVDEAIKMLRANPNVEYASRNIYLYALGIDERYAEQWALDYIQAFEAWGLFTGSLDIVVAIIDNGIEFSHPDLQTNIWLNPGENGLDGYGNQKWNNGIDDDFNGKTDDYRGWDFGQGDNDPSHDSNDNSSHGTEMAGNIGATWNDEGIRGINQSVSLMILKFTNTFPPPVTSKASHFINAIDYAISNGASIISCSQGFKTTDTGDDIKFEYLPFKQAIQRAQSRGVLFVAAAGNDGNSIEPGHNPIYPAS